MIYFKEAQIHQAPLILAYINKIAFYEKMGDEVENSVEEIKKWVFEEKLARVIFIYSDQRMVGFALYYFHYSTFSGKCGLYVDDVYIDEGFRNQGIGKKIFVELAKIASDKDCGRMEWCCLKWNTNSIAFYEKLGAIQMLEWDTFRLDAIGIKNIIAESV